MFDDYMFGQPLFPPEDLQKKTVKGGFREPGAAFKTKDEQRLRRRKRKTAKASRKRNR